MKIKKMTIIISLMIILSLIIIKDIYGLGVSPGSKTIDFKPYLREKIDLTLYNEEQKEFKAIIMARGEIGNYVKLEENTIEFKRSDSQKSFEYELNLPEKFDKPGTWDGDIVIREIPIDQEADEIIVDALVSVVSKINVRVPYPGKYVDANFYILSGDKNENVRFILRIMNLGKENIKLASAIINIYDSDDNLVHSINTDEKSIKKTERKELIASWNADAGLGRYKALAILNYDGEKTEFENEFIIGEFFLRVLDISVKKFNLGDIAKYNILVENLANDKITQVSSQMLLYDEKGDLIADIKSNPDDIEANSLKELISYWDTENIEQGTYEGKIILKYDDKNKESRIRTTVSQDKIETEIIGVTGFVAAVEQPSEVSLISTTNLIILGIIILIFSNIGWFIYIKKFKKK